MATKKAAPKKATKKTAKKVVKRPAKKAVKKATRKYTKRVIKNTPVMGCSDCEKAAMDFMDNLIANAHNEAQSVEVTVQQIGALDLRYSPIPERFAVLMLLSQLGYVATNLGPLVHDLDNLNVMLKADSLRFNHVNKILIAGLWEDIQDVEAIATVHANTSSEFNFDKPRPAYPETYFIGDAEYVRVK